MHSRALHFEVWPPSVVGAQKTTFVMDCLKRERVRARGVKCPGGRPLCCGVGGALEGTSGRCQARKAVSQVLAEATSIYGAIGVRSVNSE